MSVRPKGKTKIKKPKKKKNNPKTKSKGFKTELRNARASIRAAAKTLDENEFSKFNRLVKMDQTLTRMLT